jgi:thioredoxin reductase
MVLQAYDVVIIGGGAAGLSGALALARARRTVLVIDHGEPRNAPAAHMHNYLSRDGTPPAELLAHGRREVLGYGGSIVDGQVIGLERDPGEGTQAGFAVRLADGSKVSARRLLLASGLMDVLPAVPGVAERWGRDVVHCPYCHGWEVRDQALGILGSGPMAVHSTLLFRQWSADVMLFQHTAPALSAEQAEQLAARGIAVVEGEVAALELDNDRLVGLRLRSGALFPRQAVVVTPRFAVRAELLAMLGLTPSEFSFQGAVIGNYLAVDAMGATGDLSDPSAQVIGAAAAGLRAGAAINADLIAEETAQAVAARRVVVHSS